MSTVIENDKELKLKRKHGSNTYSVPGTVLAAAGNPAEWASAVCVGQRREVSPQPAHEQHQNLRSRATEFGLFRREKGSLSPARSSSCDLVFPRTHQTSPPPCLGSWSSRCLNPNSSQSSVFPYFHWFSEASQTPHSDSPCVR